MNFRLILLITLSPHIIVSLITQTKNTFTFRYNETYWESLSPFTPINNASYGTIKLGRSLRMEFKFIYFSRRIQTDSVRYHENAFRIGYSSSISNTGTGAGSRYPSMWIYYLDGVPHCKFSVSSIDNPWKEFLNLFALEPHGTYSVLIEFNQTHIFISITDTTHHHTYIVTDSERLGGTGEQYLDTFMHIWISQFGHHQTETPAANISMFDVSIQTWDHDILPSPTTNPTTQRSIAPTISPLSPTTSRPTRAPIVIASIVSSEPIELYEFYNEYVVAYKQNVDLYAEFIYDAIVLALENVTGHSMDINDGSAYYDAPWVFG
eukprot:307956_1